MDLSKPFIWGDFVDAIRPWVLIYLAGVIVTWIITRYLVRRIDDQRLLTFIWPVTWGWYLVMWLFRDFPAWAFRRLNEAVTRFRVDYNFDFWVWLIFKHKIDESELGILYRGPGPRNRPIHRLRVTDPSLGHKYWLTVPDFCETARRALFWTWGLREFDGEIADHV